MHHASRLPRFLFAMMTIPCLLAVRLPAQEWTRFRGPNGTGESECKTIPTTWTENDYLWKSPIPGIGHSSPVIWGDKLFIFSASPTDAIRHCLAYSTTDGKQLWKVDFKSEPHHLHPRSSFASATPAVDKDQVYFAWSTPKDTTLIAFDHGGSEVWRKNLGPWVSQHGFGTSPIVHGDLVIVNNAQDDDPKELKGDNATPGKSSMMAFNRKTGAEIWRVPLSSGTVSYSVPMIRELPGGKAEVVCTNTGDGMYGIDAATGKMTWSVPNCFKLRTVSSPVFTAGLLFGSCGSGADSQNAVIAVTPGAAAKVAYELKNSSKLKAPYVPSLVCRGNYLFLVHDKGYASCVDATNGDVLWSTRIEGGFSGSPIRIQDRIYCINELGEVVVFAADKEFKVLARNPLGEPSRSTPAVSGGKMFLRTYSNLICVGEKS